jgi:uncharacterized protein (TIGR03663 family)
MTDVSTAEGHSSRTAGLSLATSWKITPEILFYLALILIVVFTRFYNLESRVMSHDESLHTQFSWYLEQGRGFSHDPLMHGPLQMHLVAFSYFLFGDSDASARFPAALSGVLSVFMVLLFRRWLGKWGTAAAAALMTFSPYMLYYSRYVRNDVLVIPFALLMFYAVFRYVEESQPKWLYLLAAALALHFTAKETAFIYTAQLLIFLGILFAVRVLRMKWEQNHHRLIFLVGLAVAGVGVVLSLGALFSGWAASGAAPAASVETGEALVSGVQISPLVPFGLMLAVGGVILIVAGLILSFGGRLRNEFPVLDLIIFILTITIPQLAALPARILGWDAMNYSSIEPLNRTIILVVVLIALSIAVGVAWNARKWLVAAGIFFGIYFVFYTTLFTNQVGIASGLVGSLGYWLKQHGVERGGQPWYYYLFIQIPMYEFLPAIGSIMSGFYLLRRWAKTPNTTESHKASFPVLAFLGYWSLTSLVAYSFAGEKMPWLTVHIALPMILFGGWGIGRYLSQVDWQMFLRKRGWLIALLLVLFLVAALRAFGILFGVSPPFQGSQLDQLEATSGFLAALAFSLGSGYALWRLSAEYRFSGLARGFGVLVLLALFVLTGRASLRASFPHADLATEYLVYAHGAPGVKTAMSQIEEISKRTTDGLALKVAFDDDVSWPLNWYLRHYSEQYYYGNAPTRELLNYPVVLVGDNNWNLVDPLLADNYYRFEYIRMWWPNQDYWTLKRSSIEAERDFELSATGVAPTPMGTFEYLQRAWSHIAPFFRDRNVREAIFQIWLNRDFTKYAEVTGKDMRLDHWSPSDRMRLYIRKDIAAEMWDYGVSQADLGFEVNGDPYSEGIVSLNPNLTIGAEGVSPGEFYQPRDMAANAEGEVYIADTGNHRIERFSAEGELLGTWGGYANLAEGNAPGGTFNEPWGLAVAPNGDVYVADTWNHRVQWFSPDGTFKGMFGSEGLGQEPFSFWGPRDVAVDSQGRVYVSDTGNKLIKVFSADGEYVGQFGGAGYLEGMLDEPVGLAVDSFDRIYVADTWNRRVQVFQEINPGQFEPVLAWDVSAWFGQSLDNKPYLAVNREGEACLTDPEGARVLCFSGTGDFLYGFGGVDQFALLSGIAFTPSGEVWVVDTGNQRAMRFNLPGSDGN